MARKAYSEEDRVQVRNALMTTMILEKQTRFTIDAYKRIAELEAKLA